MERSLGNCVVSARGNIGPGVEGNCAMRITAAAVIGLLVSTSPVLADEVIIQTPNPNAADHAAGAAHQAGRDAHVDRNIARRDQAIANHDAASGHYGLANDAERDAHAANRAAGIDNHIAGHDAAIARHDDSYHIEVTP